MGERHALPPYEVEVILKACFSPGEFKTRGEKADASRKLEDICKNCITTSSFCFW